MRRAVRHIAAWLEITAVLGVTTVASAAVIRVAPNGSDDAAGTQAAPLATLVGARDAVRKLKAEGLTEPVRVVVADGEYFVTGALEFGPEDSGTAEAPVTYEAAEGAKPVFTGGRRIEGWTEGQGGMWMAKVPGVAEGDWYFEQLWVNGKRATRARSPNKHYFYTRGKVNEGIDPATGQRAGLGGRAFRAEADDIAGVPDSTDVTVVVYHSWEAARLRLAGINRDENTVVTTAATPWGFEQWGPSQRYHLENYLEALDAPGEWFLGRDGTLHYMPREGEDMAAVDVIAPMTAESFIAINGETGLGMPVEHITFRGLAFRHGQYILPPEGHADGQAEFTIPATVMLDGAKNITFEDCEVGHHGLYTFWFRRGCQDCTVSRCYLHDMGAGGVRIGEGAIQPDEADRTGNITVDNCIIHSGARIHFGAHGVWIGHSPYNKVTHNDISDFHYTLVSVGWRWGYAESLAHHNTIDFNHLHHSGWGMLSDMGAVYTLGPSPGTTVSNNHCHHIYSYDHYGRGGWGLYNDEGSSYITMENNLVHHVKTGTYHQHYGTENIVRNNILAYSMNGQLQRSRVEEHLSFTYQNNIVLWDEGEFATAGQINDDLVKLESNMYWRESDPDIDFQGLTLAERQEKGWDEGSVIEDPMFVDPHNGDFTFKPGAPYEKIGFVPFDYKQAGVYGDEAWTKLAGGFEYPEVDFAPDPPPPPPMTFTNDFEMAPVGSQLADAKVYTENKGDSVSVTEDAAANGERSLKITDAPGLEHEYNPHFYWSPNHTSGVTTFAFDMRVDEGAVLYHEWRDNSNPYKVGPSIWVRDGMLQIQGQDRLALPVGEWVHFEVTAGLGEDSTGTWSVTVTLPDGDATAFEGLDSSADWKSLTWLGFSSNAAEARVFYLDNLELRNGE